MVLSVRAIALDADRRVPVAARDERDHRRRHRRCTWKRGKLLLDPGIQRTSADGVVARSAWRDGESNEVLDADAEINALDLPETLEEEPRAHEQRHREGDLRRGEGRAEASRSSSTGQLAGVVPERRDEIGARAVERREETERDSRHERQHSGEADRRPVHA